MLHRLFFHHLILACLLWLASCIPMLAECPQNQKDLETKLDSELNYLISLAGPKTTIPFETKNIECLLDFIQNNQADPTYRPSAIKGTTPAYYEFTLKTSLTNLLRYCYGSELYSCMMMPSAVRSETWLEIEGDKQATEPDLSERLPNLTAPYSFCGIGHQDLTPDINTGAYFSYDEDRCLILIPGRQKTFISISVQRDKSDVGKKGAVIGDDNNWIYLYSGQEGVTKRGIGWAKTYLYSAYSVALYTETKSNTTKVGTFKWLDAGWAGFNMVKTKHVVRGMTRFADTLKSIMESQQLPSYQHLLAEQKKIARLPLDELRKQVKPHIDTIAAMDDPLVKRKPFSKMLSSGEYLQSLSRTDMEKIVLTEYLKNQLERLPKS